MKYFITDADYMACHVEYIEKTLHDTVQALGGRTDYKEADGRAVLKITLPDTHAKFFRDNVELAVADAIIVGYKWEFLKKKVKGKGLSDTEHEHLFCALIQADYCFDLGYVIRRLGTSPYSVDGCYNFCIKPMINKWEGVMEELPCTFSSKRLRDFISFLSKETKGEKYYVSKEGVFNSEHVKMRKSMLTGGYDLVKELVLAAPGSIELDCPLDDECEKWIKHYYGDKIFFGKGYIG